MSTCQYESLTGPCLSRRATLRTAGIAAAAMVTAGCARKSAAAQESTLVATPRTNVQPDLTGAAPSPLTGERRAQFEAYVADALLRFGVPGASVAVVQNGAVVYLNGVGVREAGSTLAVDPDTMFMIGSITKSMTTMLAATLVDDGRLTWETPLVDLLPAFAVGDPALTESLTVRDAFCNCIGLPGRDLEFFFAGDTFTPEGVVTALAGVAPTANRGERFQYNNLLISAGGYALGVTAEGSAECVLRTYDVALRERILGPMGMTRLTFQSEEVLAGGNYALPHAIDLTGRLQAIPVAAEQISLSVAPSGQLWSNAREMARYVETELAHGVAPNGTRVVSAEQLAETWAPGVALSAEPRSVTDSGGKARTTTGNARSATVAAPSALPRKWRSCRRRTWASLSSPMRARRATPSRTRSSTASSSCCSIWSPRARRNSRRWSRPSAPPLAPISAWSTYPKSPRIWGATPAPSWAR